MNSNLQFYKILDVIGYKGDKETIAKIFMGFCYSNALADLIKTLQENQKKEATKELLGVTDEHQIQKLTKFFTKQQINDAFIKSSKSFFKEYFKSIGPTLSENQLSELDKYISSLS